MCRSLALLSNIGHGVLRWKERTPCEINSLLMIEMADCRPLAYLMAASAIAHATSSGTNGHAFAMEFSVVNSPKKKCRPGSRPRTRSLQAMIHCRKGRGAKSPTRFWRKFPRLDEKVEGCCWPEEHFQEGGNFQGACVGILTAMVKGEGWVPATALCKREHRASVCTMHHHLFQQRLQH